VVIEPGVFAISEPRVELRPLEREGIDKENPSEAPLGRPGRGPERNSNEPPDPGVGALRFRPIGAV
jgi:hypothetical protein